jgi:hypothetical protein
MNSSKSIYKNKVLFILKTFGLLCIFIFIITGSFLNESEITGFADGENATPTPYGPYPTLTIVYSGCRKPQNGLADYTGVPDSHYSTVWAGRYSTPTPATPPDVPTPGVGEYTGRHAGVDIQLGDCYPTNPTEIRAIAPGEIIELRKDWDLNCIPNHLS